jgi:D-glycero-D-manno-heptose 1,7-bisphosphate phosphatase
MGSPAVFLDKDGTLIEDVPYNVDPSFIRLMPGARDGLARLQAEGYRLVVITNQSGVARGYFSEGEIEAVGEYLTRMLAVSSVTLNGFYFCPHLAEGCVERYSFACGCRKPEIGLILEAARRHDLDVRRSWFVGDIASDIEAGRRAGCRTVLVGDRGQIARELAAGAEPDVVAADLVEAARAIVEAGIAEGTGPPRRQPLPIQSREASPAVMRP